MKHIITSFSKTHWEHWGIGWIASLIELAKFDGYITIILHDPLPERAAAYLTSLGINLVAAPSHSPDPRLVAFETIQNLASENDQSIYAYWDGDCFFQDNLNPLFELVAENDFQLRYCVGIIQNFQPLIRRGTSAGMLIGAAPAWSFFKQFTNFQRAYRRLTTSADLVEVFTSRFPATTQAISPTWNWLDLSQLRLVDNKLQTGDMVVKVVHPVGGYKFLSESYTFQKCYPYLFANWASYLNGNRASSRRLIRNLIWKK